MTGWEIALFVLACCFFLTTLNREGLARGERQKAERLADENEELTKALNGYKAAEMRKPVITAEVKRSKNGLWRWKAVLGAGDEEWTLCHSSRGYQEAYDACKDALLVAKQVDTVSEGE